MSKVSLFDSIRQGDLKHTKSLIEEVTNINIKDNKGETPLHIAVDKGHLEIVKLLVEKGADINARVSYPPDGKWEGGTALHYAIESDLEIAKFLIEKGADANIHDFEGQSPLDRALDLIGEEEAKSLFSANKNISLSFAIAEKNLEAGEALIKEGADINQTGHHKSNTFLHLTAGVGNLKLVKLCVEKGANVNRKNDMQKTPLDYTKSKEIRDYLKSQGGKASSLLDKSIGIGSWLIVRCIALIIGIAIVYGLIALLKAITGLLWH